MSSRKRLTEEFENLSQISSPSKIAKLHGKVTNLSTMKSTAAGNSSYFEGQFSDETCSLRVVGFDALQQQKLAQHQEEEQAIMLENCEVKKARYGDSMEVLIKQLTTVVESPRKLENVVTSEITTLDQLNNLEDYKSVTISIKVLQVTPKIEVKPGLEKQDLIISDATET